MRTEIKTIFDKIDTFSDKEVVLKGWVRNNRAQKEFGFIDLSDGTCFESAQVVYEETKVANFKDAQKIRVGSSVSIKGIVTLTPDSKQPFEIKATEVELLGDSSESYPIQPKRHTREFLRTQAHLRPRTNLFNAVFRVRSVAAHAIHTFFQERNFIYAHTPLITANDGEGAGEGFTVTTAELDKLTKPFDYSNDFFGKKTSLAVTGQLEAEAFALSFGKTYTFGPTFRAENSNTQRHAAEFWMIEPEVAFNDIEDNMQLAEDMVKYVVKYVMDKCPSEMVFFDGFVEKGLKDKLEKVISSEFKRITHEAAIEQLIASGVKFENEPKQGEDLATEHEKYLTEVHGPVFVTNWPKDIKAFYMKQNDDGKTVAAMDLLVPGSGELIGGSERETDLDKLTERMNQLNIPLEDLEWYLDLRRFGGCVHSGYGMGFERLIMYLTGVENIRDVIPFPRTPRNCDF